MAHEESISHARKSPQALGGIFPNIYALLKLVPRPRWAPAALITLGILSSLAEMIGIMLIPLFLYSMMNRLQDLALNGGLLGAALRFAVGYFRSSREIALVFLFLIILRGLLAYTYNTATSHISEQLNRTMREHLHRLYLELPYGDVVRHEQADLVQALGTEVYLLAKAYTSLTRIFINSTFIVILGLLLAIISWKITLWVVFGSLALSALLHLLSARARAVGVDARRIHRELWDAMLITLQGLRVLRAFGNEEHQQRRFREKSAAASNIAIRELQLILLLDPLTEVAYLAILVLLLLGAQSFGIPFATTLTCVALLYRLQPHVRELEGHRLTLLSIDPQLGSVLQFFMMGEPSAAPTRKPILEVKNGIAFQNVCFRYEAAEELALDKISFNIPANKTTALVGSSGSGKTTIANLLLQLYKPQSGSILVDGVPLPELSPITWLKLIAIAGQDTDLIDGTIFENIQLADPQASEAEIAAAAEMMGIADLVDSLPQGYQTRVGHRGLRLSGGQRQRIALARAVLHKPSILILDEATNALDLALERRVRDALRQHFQASTILLITHSVEAVLDADHLICIEAGRVLAEGRPSDVLDRNAREISIRP